MINKRLNILLLAIFCSSVSVFAETVSLSSVEDDFEPLSNKSAYFTVFDEQSIIDTSGFVPSGWAGDYESVTYDYNSIENPHSGKYCCKWKYSGINKPFSKGWVYIYWQNPANNWGNLGKGLNLSKFKKITFWARGEKGGEVVRFGMGGIKEKFSDSAYIGPRKEVLTKNWKQYILDLQGQDLSCVIGGFLWMVDIKDNPKGCTFYLDQIKYE